MLVIELLFAACLALATSTVHFAGLVGLSAFLRKRRVHPINLQTLIGQGASILTVVMALMVLHAIEIWIYALTYLALGEFGGSMEEALYFSTTAFTTAGIGDVLLSPEWRMLGAAETANGFLLIGWSTAFLVSLTARVRAFEADVERLEDNEPHD